MKIIDCFNYFDEDMPLDLRLNILNEYVSKFVICEANYSHKGTSKKLNFNIKNFTKFKDKIIYVPLQTLPLNLKKIEDKDNLNEKNSKIIENCLIREEFQRNFIMDKISEFDDQDLIIYGDLDEIPNLKNFTYKSKISLFCQKMFYYKFNLVYPDHKWYGTKACKKKHLTTPQLLRFIKSKKYPVWRIDTFFSKLKYIDMNIINDGGWHFCNIKNPEKLHYKMKNFAHHLEYDNSRIELEDLKKKISQRQVFYDHSADKKDADKYKSNINLKIIQDKFLPNYLIKNKDFYKEWFEVK